MNSVSHRTRSNGRSNGDARPYLDTDFEIPAPEYILFRYTLAGPLTRLFAVLIDHVLILGLIMISFLILFVVAQISAFAELETVSGLATFVLFMVMFLLNWFYFLAFEWGNRTYAGQDGARHSRRFGRRYFA